MIHTGPIPEPVAEPAVQVEHVLRDELAEGDAALASTRPILQHLLANRDQALFSDEVIARVRGMVTHVARQLLHACAEAGGIADVGSHVADHEDGLAQLLLDDSAFLAHAHALTQEAQLADQLQRRSAIDGVLSPLLQELAAAADAEMAAAAMRVIAAQARFLQTMRRMEMPLGELPGDLFHQALVQLRAYLGDDAIAGPGEERLRADYDEGLGRLGQLSRLVMALGQHATRALAIDHAGLAVFATALGMASRQDRNVVVLAFGENQLARLALALRAAGLSQPAVEEQFLFLHPDALLPDHFASLTPARAMAVLTAATVAQGD